MNQNWDFSFSYSALKLLGKSLYTNPFSAISELIANGFDAGATKVFIYIDARKMNDSHVEVIDNGSGMSLRDIKEKYLLVGKSGNVSLSRNEHTMGRKGVGKLAAFYLSDYYFLITKQKHEEENIFKANFSLYDETDQNQKASLEEAECCESFVNKALFGSFISGSAVVLEHVKFNGYGEDIFQTFSASLSEMFDFGEDSYQKDLKKEIKIKIVRTDDDTASNFVDAERKVGFGNMLKICTINNPELFKYLNVNKNNQIHFSEKNGNKDYYAKQIIENYSLDSSSLGIASQLGIKGWIGIHSTLKAKQGLENDPNLKITSFFKPFRIRLYVRGKRVLDNLTKFINSHQFTYNYLEGDIFCDSLDSNDKPDIISTNRESIDINDERMQALLDVVGSISRKLSEYWSDKSRDFEKHIEAKQMNASKVFVENVEKLLQNDKGKTITEESIGTISRDLNLAIKQAGNEVVWKTNYRIFLSHCSADKCISDFIFEYLTCVVGFPSDWFFYTSKIGSESQIVSDLEKQIRSCVTDNNCLLVFCMGHHFKESEYALFEAGGAWAVRQQSTILMMYDEYNSIPDYMKLMNHKLLLESKKEMCLDTYQRIVNFLNYLISYLNGNYENSSDKKSLIQSLPYKEFDLHSMNKTIYDVGEKEIIERWKYMQDSSDISENEVVIVKISK